jgi:beta-glucosidase
MRLLGFERIELGPGESRRVTLTADPRVIARFDGSQQQWRINEGTYRVALAKSADDFMLTAEAAMPSRLFGH